MWLRIGSGGEFLWECSIPSGSAAFQKVALFRS
jgi:hypothetical protein